MKSAMDHNSKADKKAKLRAWREAKNATARLALPLPDTQLSAFFDGVEALRAKHGCFHDTRHAEVVLATLGVPPGTTQSVLSWCEENGGFCDCEITANTREHWAACLSKRLN